LNEINCMSQRLSRLSLSRKKGTVTVINKLVDRFAWKIGRLKSESRKSVSVTGKSWK